MDNSTDGVTLLTGFVFDVLAEYESMRKLCKPAFDMAAHLTPGAANDWCDIVVYNDICDWIEKNVGPASIRNTGRAIGKRAYDEIVRQGKLQSPTPLAMMESLKWAADNMIKDPKGRGWTLLPGADDRVQMRRTQTFNCLLQEGLLLSLVERTGALMPSVAHYNCTRRGDEFCEYRVSWLGAKKST